MTQPLNRGVNLLVDFLASPPLRKFSWANLSFLSLLFVGGLYQWCKFLNWGKGPLNFHDWADITGPRLTFLQDAMVKGIVPLHTANTEALGGITTRFMSIPDVFLSPQIILLRYLDLDTFIIFQLGLMYTLGFLGLLQLRKKFKLSTLAFSIIFLLYNFNGHILAHFSVGHFTWGGYFLFIWFALLIFDLLEGKSSWHWVTNFALLLLAILLQGSYHQFVWCILFMLFLAIFSIKNMYAIIKAVTFSILISMVRLLPPFILLGKFNNQFIAGYRDILSIINCLTHLLIPRSPIALEDVSPGISTWESTLYVGIIGAAFLFYFGIWRAKANSDAGYSYKVLLLPALCLTFLSLERIFQTFRELFPLPLLTGERISSRMISLAFVFILVLATIEFQNWLNQSQASKISIIIPGILILLGANDLWQNYVLWSFGRASGEFPVQGFTAAQWYVANDWSDTQYLSLIVLGLAISILCLAFLIYKVWKEKLYQSKKGD